MKLLVLLRVNIGSLLIFLGCPAIVVGISAGLASEGYGNKRL